MKIAGTDNSEDKKLENHVIIVGYGLNGRNLASVLKRRKIPFAIIELNPDSVKEAENRGEVVIYGDATKAKILEAAGIKTARVITFAISDTLVIDHAVSTARYLNQKVIIIARTKYVTEIDRLYELGADTVYAEEYEASIEILGSVMTAYNIPRETINREINILHSKRYAIIRDRNILPGDATAQNMFGNRVHSQMPDEINIDTFTVTKNCLSAGRSIAELEIRKKAGATIISVVRKQEHFANPQPDFKLAEGDKLILMGSREQIEGAIDIAGSEAEGS